MSGRGPLWELQEISVLEQRKIPTRVSESLVRGGEGSLQEAVLGNGEVQEPEMFRLFLLL